MEGFIEICSPLVNGPIRLSGLARVDVSRFMRYNIGHNILIDKCFSLLTNRGA